MTKKFITISCVLSILIAFTNGNATAAPMQFKYKWSDGPAVAVKNLTESKYVYETDVPTVDATLPITDVPREVSLQYKYKGEWFSEDTQITSNGFVSLTVYPLYEDGSWIRGTWDYRLVVTPMAGQPNFKNIMSEAFNNYVAWSWKRREELTNLIFSRTKGHVFKGPFQGMKILPK
jgi:hypothetical protein